MSDGGACRRSPWVIGGPCGSGVPRPPLRLWSNACGSPPRRRSVISMDTMEMTDKIADRYADAKWSRALIVLDDLVERVGV